MNDKEYIKKVCSKCANRYNENDLCNIVRTMDGNYRCSKEYIEAEKKIRKMLDDIMKPVAEVFEGIAKTLSEISADVVDITKKIVDGVFKVINSNWNKKISKKKFIKLLQSNGIQRNDINKIVRGNKEKYTYLRYYDIVTKLKKQNNKT